ncbi:T9SS type A sorting domain-containing protein [candidate division KSB1 bacterium]|nr:T9SS type A sorting domain-containing protein [candidate division KSB1 bacterium]
MRFFFLLALLLLHAPLSAVTIKLHEQNAVVWSRIQLITGEVDTMVAATGWLLVNGDALPFQFQNQSKQFSVQAILEEGVNILVARVDSSGVPIYSDTLRLTLGYKLRPEVYAYATVANRTVILHGTVLENPRSAVLSFFWRAEANNPMQIDMANRADSVASFVLPEGAPLGEYYFNLNVYSANGDTTKARTLVTATSEDILPFNIKTDHTAWIDRAIIYEITPYNFVAEGKFNHVTQKIPELAALGVNTIWLQPVYRTRGRGQGYDVTDYFAVRNDLGSEADLRTLIATAHAHGLKVLFDFVPNHTSIYHPYAQDAIRYGPSSHYYDFYQRSRDNAPYAMHYNTRQQGLMQFIYYFWNELVNLNYDSPEVQRMMIEAGKYWIEKFDIDGYRIDAVWGVNARRADFMQQWRLALKRVKPEVLLLGEDKATWPMVFEERFDAAYDWAPEEPWVSHWVWQTSYSTSSNPTIFNNSNQSTRAALLRAALTNSGTGYAPRARILRFMENNDTFRFLPTHDRARTKMVAALMFALHGIPLLYNGQEIGFATHPYQTYAVFNSGQTIKALDKNGLFPYYQKLAQLRKDFPALHSDNFQEVAVTPNASIYAFRRWEDEQNIFAIINMGNAATSAAVKIPVAQLALDSAKTYYLTDLLNAEYISGTPTVLSTVSISLPAYTTRMFILSDTLMATSVESPAASSLPNEFKLAQNYPNPFNPTTTIEFDLPRSGRAGLRVYDLLGRKVITLFEGEKQVGHHKIIFDGKGMPSGIYFYRLQFGENSLIRKMILAK